MRLKQSVQLGDAAHQLVKARAQAEGRSVRDVVYAALDMYLGQTVCPTCHRRLREGGGSSISPITAADVACS